MEVDILNDILSRTVSNLFSDKLKHMSYVSEDDEGKKSELSLDNEINIQKNLKNKNDNVYMNQKNIQNEPQTKKNLIEKLINNNIQKNNSKQNNNIENNQNNQKAENLSPKKWCLTIGKKKYEESLKRLQISEKMIASKTLIAQMNLEQLVNEKARVKQELKKYDEDFYHVFKTKPAKENKEVMKPLYYYYQKIKLEITKKSNNKNENNSETIIRNERHNNQSNLNTQTNPNHLNYMNNTNNTQNTFPSTITYNDSTLNQESSYGNSTINSGLNSNQMQIENNRTNKFSINNTYHNNSKTNSINNINSMTNNTNYNVFHRKANSGGGISTNTQKQKKEDFVINKTIKKRSLSKEEINALEQEYFNIKNEQNNLTQMLRNYQNEFQKTNNRKVKWAKDIKPVEKEYNKYKMNKERIKQIKELFVSIESNNK